MVRSVLGCVVVFVACTAPQRGGPVFTPMLAAELAAALEKHHYAHPPANALERRLRDAERSWPLPSPVDRGTRILSAAEADALMQELVGQDTTGMGLPELLSVDVSEKTGAIEVVTPVPGSPAAKAGLLPRDRLVEIDGEPVHGLTLAEAMTRLRGPIGSNVTLVLERAGASRRVTLTRERYDAGAAVEPSSWPIRRSPGGTELKVGYLRIARILPSAGEDVARAVDRLALDGSSSLIVDLRDNPGGDLFAAANVVGVLAGETAVAELQGWRGPEASMRATGPARTQLPIVVLVNEGTASAAEIIAGALQAAGRAKVVGTRTYGKGLAHLPVPLSDGSTLLVSVARAVTPHGRDILDAGIEPDVKSASRGSVRDSQLEAAVALLFERLERP